MKLTKNIETITKNVKIRSEYDDYGVIDVVYYNLNRYIIESDYYPCDNVHCYVADRYISKDSKEVLYITKNDDDNLYYITTEVYE